MITNYLMRN